MGMSIGHRSTLPVETPAEGRSLLPRYTGQSIDLSVGLEPALDGRMDGGPELGWQDSFDEDTAPRPRQVGPYRITGVLGCGGMGQIFRGYHPGLDRSVAIKAIHGDGCCDEDVRRRFRREARLLAKIQHRAVVQVYDLLELPEGEYIVMELVEGRSLRHLAAAGEIRSIRQILSIARQITEGLGAAHRLHIVHRDLKSENIMVTPDGDVKLLDFGLAQSLESESTAGARPSMPSDRPVMGTLRTMSPEQAKGLPMDMRSDLFALGVLLYELITCDSPFLAENIGETLRRICTEHQRPIRYSQPNTPNELSHLIDHLLEKDPDRRPQDTAFVAATLDCLEKRYRHNPNRLLPSPTTTSTCSEPTLPSIPHPRL